MQVISIKQELTRKQAQAGIAIGPILFVVAILAVLAGAIAAGSGSFTSSTANETSRTNAAALIQAGQNLKIGFDRISGNGIAFSSVDINPANTSATDDLFSPTGGGIAPPSAALTVTPGTDVWVYPSVNFSGFGTTAVERLAVVKVPQGTCAEINAQALGANVAGTNNLPTGADIGNPGSIAAPGTWANIPAAFNARQTGCVVSTTTGNATYGASTNAGNWFYQVIGIQ